MKRLALVLLLLCGRAWSQAADPPGEKLLGLWRAEQIYGPMARGDLTIDARGPEWHARIAGFDVVVEHPGPLLRFELPGDQGEFRGRWAADKRKILGEWVQPPGPTLNQRYASPVRLQELMRGVWRGTVTPLDQRVMFFVMIERKADGSLGAYIRNPEHNWFGRGTYVLTRKGDEVTLQRGGQQIEGRYDAESDSLWLGLVDGVPPLKATRRRREEALGFVPRLPGSAYRYQQPIDERDGWQTGSLAEAGLDPKQIGRAHV